MARRLTDVEKNDIIKSFSEGIAIEELSEKYNCSKLTISRNLKKNFDEESYKELVEKSTELKRSSSKSKDFLDEKICNTNSKQKLNEKYDLAKTNNDESNSEIFMEIAPLGFDIDNTPQKDISSIPISEVAFPKTVYMIVDKKIELQTKYLREYPEWEFLSKEELNRKTIEIYDDLKVAKRFCNKEQKVIKVPNSNVFKIASYILLEKGISRIVSANKLIAL